MNAFQDDLVRIALARHLDVEIETIRATDQLEHDLGLDPLDLVLIVLRLEELAETEFAVAELESTRTVADLEALVAGWRVTLTEVVSPASQRRRESGVQSVADRSAIRKSVTG